MRPPDPVGQLAVPQAAVFTRRRRGRYRGSVRLEASERVVDAYGLVCKAGIGYLVVG